MEVDAELPAAAALRGLLHQHLLKAVLPADVGDAVDHARVQRLQRLRAECRHIEFENADDWLRSQGWQTCAALPQLFPSCSGTGTCLSRAVIAHSMRTS